MSYRNKLRPLLGSVAALGLFSGLWTSSASAAAYTLVPSGTGSALDWNTASTWSPSGIPGALAGDIVTVGGDYGGFAQTVNISGALTTPLTTLLTLGDTNATPMATTIGSTGGSLALSGATINSAGAANAVNTISAPIALSGNLTFASALTPTLASANALTISGKITTGGASRAIENNSGQAVTLGDIDISTGAGTGVVLTVRNGNTSGISNDRTILAGTIADGGTAATGLTLGNRVTGATMNSIQIDGTNTYTGNTNLNFQGNQTTLFLINSNQPFGPAATGNLNIGGTSSGTSLAILEAINGDRTITKNDTRITRNVTFQGSNSLALNGTNLLISNSPIVITNNITTSGKAITLGTAGGNVYLNNDNIALFRARQFSGAGTTVIASNIADNAASAGAVAANSRQGLQVTGTGTLILTGTNTFQGGVRITGTGTLQLGDGNATGSITPTNSITPIVNGTGAGTLAFNRSDAVTTTITANGPLGIAQKGSGSVTLTNSQFNSGANTIGDGATSSKLVVSGSLVPVASTSTNATVVNTTNGQLTVNTVTLAGNDVTGTGGVGQNGLNLKVGQPVYLTSGGANSLAYVDSIISPTQFTVFGTTVLAVGGAALSFGEGSALGTSAATTTVNNLATLAGTGVIAGSVNALAGSHLAPGATDGVAGLLKTGALSLTGATLDFDLAATAAGVSDTLETSGTLSFGLLNFTFNALTAGVLETGVAYDLITGAGLFTGDVNQISTAFAGGLSGYVPTYSLKNEGGLNILDVTFAAIPEPSSAGLLLGVAALGGCLGRRRRSRA